MSDYDLVKTLRMNYLFDFYQALLTKTTQLLGTLLFTRFFIKRNCGYI